MASTIFIRTRTALLWLFCLAIALVSWRFMVGGVEATMAFVAYHADLRPLAFYAHVTLAPLALALLPFQLWNRLRAARPAVHKALGRIYGAAVLLSGAGGLWLAINTQAGAVAAWGFGVLAIAWLFSTGLGISWAIRGNAAAHRRWMIRSAALTLSAVTLRLYLPIPVITGLPFEEAYMAISWLCWVPNLMVAELVIRRPEPLKLQAA